MYKHYYSKIFVGFNKYVHDTSVIVVIIIGNHFLLRMIKNFIAHILIEGIYVFENSSKE